MNGREERDERGAAIVWALALVWVLLLVGFAAAGVTAQTIARQRAATAADIAALAGAQGLGDPCVFAERSARANGMALASCTIEGSDVTVEVTAPPPAVVGRLLAVLGRDAPPVSATARAGPPST